MFLKESWIPQSFKIFLNNLKLFCYTTYTRSHRAARAFTKTPKLENQQIWHEIYIKSLKLAETRRFYDELCFREKLGFSGLRKFPNNLRLFCHRTYTRSRRAARAFAKTPKLGNPQIWHESVKIQWKLAIIRRFLVKCVLRRILDSSGLRNFLNNLRLFCHRTYTRSRRAARAFAKTPKLENHQKWHEIYLK